MKYPALESYVQLHPRSPRPPILVTLGTPEDYEVPDSRLNMMVSDIALLIRVIVLRCNSFPAGFAQT